MRSKSKTRPKLYDVRTIDVFLWFPITLPLGPTPLAKLQTRWLERAQITQTYHSHRCGWHERYWADWDQ